MRSHNNPVVGQALIRTVFIALQKGILGTV